MCQKESWGAIFATTEAHSTQRDQPPRMHGPGLWMYEQKEQRVTPVRMIGVNCILEDRSAPVCKHRLCTASFLSLFFPKLLELVVRFLDLLLRLALLPRPELFWRLFGPTYSFFVSFSALAQCLRPLLRTLPTYFARCTMRPPIFTVPYGKSFSHLDYGAHPTFNDGGLRP